MSAAKHTPGSWDLSEVGAYSDFGGKSRVILGDDMRLAVVHAGGEFAEENEANAFLMTAAPELLAIVEAFEFTGPDGDGLVWFQYRGGKMGAINVGHRYSIVGQAALAFEAKRRAALAKARGEA